MPIYTLPYSEYQGPPSPAFATGRLARRPVLRITLRNGNNHISCYTIVDSGADDCVFPRSFMQPLGLDPLTAPTEMTSGVGNPSVATHYSTVTIDLQGQMSFPVYAGFTTGMDHLGIGLLGQAGFFERFKITFDYNNRLYVLETI